MSNLISRATQAANARSKTQGGKTPNVTAVQRCIIQSCGATYGIGEQIYACRRCGGPLEIEFALESLKKARDLPGVWTARGASREPRDRSGVWRYRELLPIDDGVEIVTLFEGNTPLYDAPRCAEYSGLSFLRLKHQGCNPTGSFKDTGMTVAVTQAAILGAHTVVCASTGNTAASLAAYAARAKLQCAILLPQGQISPSKLAQSMDYGAIVCEIAGNFDDCMRLIGELADEPSIYIANSINPFRIEGQKTVAFELMQQCDWQVPGHVIVPGGNMGNSSALGKGFDEMLRLGLIGRLPKISVIQAEGAAPLAHLFAGLQSKIEAESGGTIRAEQIETVQNPRTLATAIKIGAPVSWKKALRAVLRSRGNIIAVSEQEIGDAKAIVGRDGIGCEPASAATVAGIRKLVASGKIQPDEIVVAILTGHVLKDPDYVSNYHRGTLSLGPGSEDTTGEPLRIHGAFQNAPRKISATKKSILENLERHR
jgi:threonine synthase